MLMTVTHDQNMQNLVTNVARRLDLRQGKSYACELGQFDRSFEAHWRSLGVKIEVVDADGVPWCVVDGRGTRG